MPTAARVPERVVHKFGGTSVADAERIRGVAEIIAARPESQRFVVVSAMRGVTDSLVRAVQLAGARDAAYAGAIEEVRRRHRATISELLPPPIAEALSAIVDRDIADVLDVLRAATLLHGYSRDTLELVSGYGEVWSAQILSAVIATTGREAGWLDARDVLTVTIRQSGDQGVRLLFDPEHNLEQRILDEQFAAE